MAVEPSKVALSAGIHQEDGAADGEPGGGDQAPGRPLAEQGDREDRHDDRRRTEGDKRGDGDADALDRPEVES